MRSLHRPRSLQAYFALRIIALMALPMLGLLIFGAEVYQQLVASLVFDRDSELGDLTALDLRLELREYSDALRGVARDPDLRSPAPETRLAALNDAASRRQQLFAGMALLDADGAIVAATREDVTHCATAAAAQHDFHSAPPPVDALISNVLIDPGTGESMIALGVSLSGDPGVAAGALLGCVLMRDSEMIDLLSSLTVGGSGYAYLVDRNGRAIYHPDAAALGADFSDRSYVQKVKAGESGGSLWDSPEGDRWIVDYTPIPEAGWGLVVKEPRDVAVAPAQFYGALLLGLGAIVVLAVFILLWTGVRRIQAPIKWLAEQTARLATGEEVKYTKTSGIAEIDTLGHAFDRTAKQIASYRSSLRRYIGLITQSQEDERRRIARELHDETVQNLISVARRIELLQDSVADPDQQAQWAALRTIVADTAQGVRHITRDLRPPVLEDLGLVNALQTLVSAMPDGADGTLRITFNVEGEPAPLDTELELMLYRIAQEAVSNVRRHARAKRVDVQLRFEDGSVQLAVIDDGLGFETPSSFAELVQRGSLGLMGIQERVWAAGGSLAIQSAPGSGTHLRVTLPITHVIARS